MVAALVIGYIIVVVIWARVYFRRKHGAGMGYGLDAIFNPGGVSAILVGYAWPITLFTARNPTPCKHQRHVLARAEARSQYENEQATYERALRDEGR